MTSRIVSRLSALNQILAIVVLASIPGLISPVHISASTEQSADLPAEALAKAGIIQKAENKPRLVFEIKNFPTITIPTINLSSDEEIQIEPKVTPEPIVNPNIAILQDYLKSKNSPLADYADHILKHQNWKLIIAISNGESGLCKHQLANNCWGITRSKGLERYESFAQGITDADFVINKYVSRGANTPEKILIRYVGWNNQNWVRAANQILAQIDQLPLVN